MGRKRDDQSYDHYQRKIPPGEQKALNAMTLAFLGVDLDKLGKQPTAPEIKPQAITEDKP